MTEPETDCVDYAIPIPVEMTDIEWYDWAMKEGFTHLPEFNYETETWFYPYLCKHSQGVSYARFGTLKEAVEAARKETRH